MGTIGCDDSPGTNQRVFVSRDFEELLIRGTI
jgi:hypothetical protein